MLFLYALLFFLLGSSVVAVPVVSVEDDGRFSEILRDRRKQVIAKMAKLTKPSLEPVEAERVVGWWRSTIVSKP